MGKYGGDGDSYYWDIQLKIYLLLNFNVFFQFLLTKFLKGELFLGLQKVDHVWSTKAKGLFSLLVFYQCISCCLTSNFYTTWMTSCIAPIVNNKKCQQEYQLYFILIFMQFLSEEWG